MGGAKAAILSGAAECTPKKRKRLLTEFGRRLRPFRDRYSPGKDMGIDDSDLRRIMNAAGMKAFDSETDSGFYTAWSLLIAAEEVLRSQNRGLAECRAAVEGFGSVGSRAAFLLYQRGATVVSVSTAEGALYTPKGLNIPLLLRLQAAHGKNFFRRYSEADRIRKEDLLRAPVDLLVPCAGSWSIDRANAGVIRAGAIVAGANNPVSREGKKHLAAQGIFCFPDFVSNCGGVLGSMLERAYVSRPRILRFMENLLRPQIQGVIRASGGDSLTAEYSARQMAYANRRRLEGRKRSLLSLGFSPALRLYKRGVIPEPAVRAFAGMYVRHLLQ